MSHHSDTIPTAIPPVKPPRPPSEETVDRPEDFASDIELVDWDVTIDVPPRRPAHTLVVRFVEGGRRPVPSDEEVED